MNNILKNQDGVTLVEVVIAMGLLVILISMFGGIIANAYKSESKLGIFRETREVQNKNVEQKVGSNSGKSTDIGTLQVELDFSGSNVSTTDFDPVYATESSAENLNLYVSGGYGTSFESDDDKYYVLAYGK